MPTVKDQLGLLKDHDRGSNTAFYSCNHFSATCFSDMHERTAGQCPASAEPMQSLLCVHRCVVTPDRVADGLFKNTLVWGKKVFLELLIQTNWIKWDLMYSSWANLENFFVLYISQLIMKLRSMHRVSHACVLGVNCWVSQKETDQEFVTLIS